MKPGHALISLMLFFIAMMLMGLSCEIERASKRISSPLWDIHQHQRCPKKPAWCTDD